MEKLKKFRIDINQLMPEEKTRPFACVGSPYNCEVFIVGINPATDIDNSFWSFWGDENGMDYSKFFESYKRYRIAKNKPQIVSPTRKRVDLMRDRLKEVGINLLDTNIYNKATPRAEHLAEMDKSTDIFEYLLKEVSPEFLVLQGSETRKYFEKQYKCSLARDKVQKVNLNEIGRDIYVLAINHLSFQTSDQKPVDIANQIIDILE